MTETLTSTVIAGVFGWPVAHSRSPLLHSAWIRRYAVKGSYVPFAVPPDRLEQALRALPALGIAGVNVTAPHKEATARIVDYLTPAARSTGSVNMVTVLPDGSLEGASTDGIGFMASLCAEIPDLVARGGPVLMLGAGGAANAIADALITAGLVPIRVTNRTDSRSTALAQRFGSAIKVWPWSARHHAISGAKLIINTTTQGMVGHPPLDLDLSLLAPGTVVNDIVYTPLETPLLAGARKQGAIVVDGLGMLLYQAKPAFARWFGVDPVVDTDLRRVFGSVMAKERVSPQR